MGIPLYFALALSMALYILGFAEMVGDVFPQLDQRWVWSPPWLWAAWPFAQQIWPSGISISSW